MHITQEHPNQPDIVALLAQLDAYLCALYPPESNHLLEIASLAKPGVVFLTARDAQARLLGCVAFVGRGDYAEIKRMMVDPACRGQGVGACLLRQVEERAAKAGFVSLKLETGISQPEALALYRRHGYAESAPFGGYQIDPLSLFMEKSL